MPVETIWRGDEVLARIRERLAVRVAAAAAAVAERARAECPVRTGALRDSIASGPAVVEGPSIRAEVTASAPHALVVEYGSATHPPHPFFRSAFAQGGGEARRIVAGE